MARCLGGGARAARVLGTETGALNRGRPVVACFATQGTDSTDERRIRELLAPLAPEVLRFDRGSKARSVMRLWRELRQLDPDVVVMEGTGIAGGGMLLMARICAQRRYIVSSGDAVGPFLRARNLPLGLAGAIYERLLYRMSAGFIGWTPYLVGRALTFGAPRAMTAAGWGAPAAGDEARRAIRARYGIPEGALVLGIVGSLNWTPRYGYCYGQELVRAHNRLSRDDIHVLVVGDGDGRERLQALAGDRLDVTVHLPGRVSPGEVPEHLAAMDVASLPQSVDGVGSFRYTTKISEYRAAGLPVVTGQIPLGYDLDDGGLWRLPGDAPWDDVYVAALADLMAQLGDSGTERRPASDADATGLFSAARQQRQVSAFVCDVVERERHLAGARSRRGRE